MLESRKNEWKRSCYQQTPPPTRLEHLDMGPVNVQRGVARDFSSRHILGQLLELDLFRLEMLLVDGIRCLIKEVRICSCYTVIIGMQAGTLSTCLWKIQFRSLLWYDDKKRTLGSFLCFSQYKNTFLYPNMFLNNPFYCPVLRISELTLW